MTNPSTTPAPTGPTAKPGNRPSAIRQPTASAGRRRGDRGEGVISTAIAVLIIAFLGAAMWVGFNTIWENAEDGITEQVNLIGG